MNLLPIKCFIPVGGQAKRLRPLSHDVAKPVVRFLNRPLIEFSMATLAEQGIRDFIFGEKGFTNYANIFDQYGEGVGFSAKYGIHPRVHIKHQTDFDDLGNADSYRLNIEYYDVKDPVIVVQGDNLFNIDLGDFIKKHEEKKALVTIALVKVDNPEAYGVVETDDNLSVKKFVEKPSIKENRSNLINAGVYLLSPEVRAIASSDKIRKMVEEKKRFGFGYDFIPFLVENGFPVYGYKLDVWYDVGTPENYLKAMVDVLHGKLNIRVTEERILPNKNVWVQGYSDESKVRRQLIIAKHKEGRISIEGAALIGRHTTIGDYTRILDSNIDNYSIIGQNVTIERSAIMDAVKIGNYAKISDSIVGRKTIIDSCLEKPTVIGSTSVIGNAVRIKEGCKLKGTKVGPNLVIPPDSVYVDKYLQDYSDVVQLVS
jgi:NDP-sugar pyrophosphorylase family protein